MNTQRSSCSKNTLTTTIFEGSVLNMQPEYVQLSCTGKHACVTLIERIVFKGFALPSDFVVFRTCCLQWGSTKASSLIHVSIYGSFRARCH